MYINVYNAYHTSAIKIATIFKIFISSPSTAREEERKKNHIGAAIISHQNGNNLTFLILIADCF